MYPPLGGPLYHTLTPCIPRHHKGQKKIRALWHHYYDGTDTLVFVIDSNDPSRIKEAKKKLYAAMSERIP